MPAYLRSEQVQEFITRKDGFFTRFSLVIFVVILLLFIASLFFIQYPMVIKGNAILIAADQPKEVAPDHNTALIKFLVKEGDLVYKNQALALIAGAPDSNDGKEMILSPMEGRFSTATPVFPGQHLIKGTCIAYVFPAKTNFLIRIILPQRDLGKVKIGQKVQLHFDAYPDQEFGVLEEKINSISPQVSDSGFYVYAQIPGASGMNDRKQIVLKDGLHSQAWIMIRNYRLIDRVFENILR